MDMKVRDPRGSSLPGAGKMDILLSSSTSERRRPSEDDDEEEENR